LQDELNSQDPAGALWVFRAVEERTLQVISNRQEELDMLGEQAVSITGIIQIDAAFVVGETGSLTLEAVQVVFIFACAGLRFQLAMKPDRGLLLPVWEFRLCFSVSSVIFFLVKYFKISYLIQSKYR